MAIIAPQVVVAVNSGEMASNFKGAYSSETTYRPSEWVMHEEGLWRCVAETTGHLPEEGSEYWRLIGEV